MEDDERKHYEARANDLKRRLKEWEVSFAQKHGKKPARDDIKANPDIAQKYKKYQRYRDVLAGKIPPPSQTAPNRKPTDALTALVLTPSSKRARPGETGDINDEARGSSSKRTKLAQTPSKTELHHGAISAVTPSVSRKLFSPVPTSIGPTPQRDGRVLGLFDMLEMEMKSAVVATPSKGTGAASSLVATPGRPRRGDDNNDDELARALGKTPVSSGRRRSAFATPHKNRDEALKTPSSGATPAFLKRHQPMQSLDAAITSPVGFRLPARPLGRSLSEMVAGLRQLEEERMDEEMEVMREMEAEEMGMMASPSKQSPTIPAAAKKPPTYKSKFREEDLLAPDAQTANLPLGGFDDESKYDSPNEEGEGKDRGGRPLRIFKKKGQKRTTRLANMRPVRAKRPAASLAEPDAEDGDADVVPETQYDAAGKENVDPEFGCGLADGEDFVPSDVEEALGSEEGVGAGAKKKRGRPKKDDGEKVAETKVKKVVRKVNELAHANFKRLKLRNTGGKRGPGYNSRFRRRR